MGKLTKNTVCTDGPGEALDVKSSSERMFKRSSLSRLCHVAALLTSTVLSGVAYAEEGAKDSDDGLLEIEDIVVTAQRREQRLSDVPISVKAHTGEMLRRAGVTDSRMLEQISPAVSFNSNYTGTTTTLSIRGAGSLANEGGIQPSVGVIMDGMPLARQGEFISDLADIDRIEVLSGPQGTLFGKNSTAGVVNIVSNKPEDEFSGLFEFSGTTDEEIIGKAMVNTPLSDKAKLRVNGYFHNISPLVKNIGPGDDLLGQKSYGIQGKLLFNVSDDAEVLFTANYNHGYSTFGSNFVITPISEPLGAFQQLVFGGFGPGVTVQNQDTTSYNKTENYALITEVNWNISDDLSLVSVTGYRNYKSRTEIDVDAGPTGVNPGIGFSPNPLGYPIEYVATEDDHQVEEYKYFSQEFRLAYSTDKLDLIGGVYYQNYDETRLLLLPIVLDGAFALQDPALAGVRFLTDDHLDTAISNNTMAAFVDATYAVAPTVNVFGGLRYTRETLSLDYSRISYFNPVDGFFDPVTGINTADPIAVFGFTGDEAKRTDKNVSGRLGIQWQPQDDMNFYASFNRGFKGAAANQGRIVQGPLVALLDPEIAEAYEVGAKMRLLDGAVSLSVALYKQTIKNIQQTAVLPNSVEVDLVNAGDLKIEGFEATVTIRPTNEITFNGGLVYNDAYYSGDDISFPCGPSATVGVGTCRADGTQDLNGTRSISTPKWKVVTSVLYDYDLEGDMRLAARVAFNWRSSIQYQLFHDPLTEEAGYGLLDASITLAADDDLWAVTIFGKNLTNKFYYSNLNTADFFIGRQFGSISRDFKRYGGIRLTIKM